MITLLPETEGNLLATRASKKMDLDDYDHIRPILDQIVEDHGRVRWYFEMKDFKGWTFSGIYEDLKLDLVHANEFEKIAMVGGKFWQMGLSRMMRPFTKGKVRYFPLSKAEEAMEWVKN